MNDGPFASRAEAQIRYAGYVRAASGQFGPAPRLNLATLSDTLDTVGVEIGAYDAEVLGRVAGLLGPLDCAVLNSLLQRAARDDYDQAVHIVNRN